jgi:putative DNA primase/helicase
MSLAAARRRLEEARPFTPDGGWPVPESLTAAPAAAPYPLEALPPVIRDAVGEAVAFTQAPVAIPAASALAVASAAAQGHADVERAPGLVSPIGLYLLTVADSGERKTTCDGFFTAPVREWERRAAEAMRPALIRHAADMDAWATKRDGIKQRMRDEAKRNKPTSDTEAAFRRLEAEKPAAPRVPRLLRGDDTPENLSYSYAYEYPAGAVVSSEAGVVFGAHGMGRDSAMRNMAFLNVIWDGGEHHVGRRTSESFTVRGARQTMSLQVQEPVVREFVDRPGGLARGSGFLARFLVAWPESTIGSRPYVEPGEMPALEDYRRRVGELLDMPPAMTAEGALRPEVLKLGPDAKDLWIECYNAGEAAQQPGGKLFDVRDVASKAADNIARMAAIFHVFEHGPAGWIGVDAVRSAGQVVDWYLGEALRFYGEMALPAETADAARLDVWLLDYCQREGVAVVPRRVVQTYLHPTVRMAPHSVGNPHKH